MRPALVPLTLLLVLLNIGYATAVVQVADQPKVVIVGAGLGLSRRAPPSSTPPCSAPIRRRG